MEGKASRAQIVEAARGMIGTPFHHQGRLPGVGLDCIGLLLCTFRKFDIYPDLDVLDYGKDPDPKRLLYYMETYLIRIPIADLLPADIPVINFERDPTHTSIFTGRNIIHALSAPSINRVVEHRYGAEWRKLTFRAYRIPGVFD